MIAYLDDESMDKAVNGPKGRSGGLIGCEMFPVLNSYDEKRVRSLKDGLPKIVSDFAITRGDGSKLRMHPNWKGAKISCTEMPPLWQYGEHDFFAPMPIPKNGIGESDGPGQFQRYLQRQTNLTLKFSN